MRERHPRTAMGWDDQYYYLVEVDGRQKRLSNGMTLNELADFLIGMGCKEAVNFDGGGSSMFWCNGRVVNSPCDKKEREIANALVVLRKPGLRQQAALTGAGPKE
jgi:exopolysaccharide biosynthesis protein